MEKLPPKQTSGQALLVILLTMAVALTIGLSVVSRSITDIKISQQTEEAARAFSAAEAGIEEALITGTGMGPVVFPETGATYQTAVLEFGEGTEFVLPQKISIDEPKIIFLAKVEADGTLTRYYRAGTIDVCWEGNSALEVGIYYQEAGKYKVARAAVDPDSSRRQTNKFSPPDAGSCAGLANKKTLSLPAGTLLFLRTRVFYQETRLGVKTPGGAGGVLPSQGKNIEATGQAGVATRKVAVVRFHPAPPDIFDFALYSGRSLAK